METLKILYLEDSDFDAEIVSRILKKAGFDFYMKLADSEGDYREALDNFKPDVVLSDHSMFQFNSVEALNVFKKYNYKIPFILITGTVSEEFAVNILKEGADDYLLKSNLVRLPYAIDRALKEKKSEREREDAFDNLKTLFRNINDVFFSIDTVNNRLIQISDGCMDVYGYPPEKFRTNSNTWLEVIHPEDKKTAEIDYARLEKGETLYSEYRIIRADDAVCWVGTKVIPSLDAAGKLIRLDGVTSEITRRKKAEDELRLKCHDLSTLIYKLAHDIKGPVATAAGLLNLSMQEVKDAGALKYFNMLTESNNKLDGVVSGLLQLIKIDAQIHAEDKIDFSEMVQSVVDLYKSQPDTRAIEFRVQNEVKSNFYSEKHLVHILLYNLVNNAVLYRNYQEPYVFIQVSEKEGCINILVKDNGIGIRREHQARVFDMFFRANEHTKGTGLGLYIVKSIIEKLKGSIKLESEERAGTSVTITLPL